MDMMEQGMIMQMVKKMGPQRGEMMEGRESKTGAVDEEEDGDSGGNQRRKGNEEGGEDDDGNHHQSVIFSIWITD